MNFGAIMLDKKVSKDTELFFTSGLGMSNEEVEKFSESLANDFVLEKVK